MTSRLLHELSRVSQRTRNSTSAAKSVKGEAWTAPFYRKLCRRPDDALEILACYTGQYGRPIPNALKKGLGQALAEFDGYQLAKYRRERSQA